MWPADVIAGTLSDVHLCLKPPLWRSAESDWLGTMKGYFEQVKAIMLKASTHSILSLPLICGGDIFDKYNPPVELVNFALIHMPHMYAVPGQHDLPNHDYDALHKSAYFTLMKAGKITNLVPGQPHEIQAYQPMRLHGFPWGYEVKPLKDPKDMYIEIAVVHEYIWCKGHAYQNAPKEKYFKSSMAKFAGYDVIITGDNHMGFQKTIAQGERTIEIVNNGGFTRRKSDEKDYQPCIGLIQRDGKVTRQALDISKDKNIEYEQIETIANDIGMEGFVEELMNLGDSAISFTDAIKHTLERKKVPDRVKTLILSTLNLETK